ncbi:MAG: FAD-dependent oxidoreductase [Gammaproteobacteria bacterium]|nr:FAD-dependent oxidoreductase [Gammaproteobacteria bacterium]
MNEPTPKDARRPADIPESTDVIVIGYGFAGGASAIAAADAGAQVLLLEKMAVPGGIPSARAAAFAWRSTRPRHSPISRPPTLAAFRRSSCRPWPARWPRCPNSSTRWRGPAAPPSRRSTGRRTIRSRAARPSSSWRSATCRTSTRAATIPMRARWAPASTPSSSSTTRCGRARRSKFACPRPC